MSANKNGSVRCDGCGKLSNHALGEYQKPDGSVGYINNQGRNSDLDYCDDCEVKLETQAGTIRSVTACMVSIGANTIGFNKHLSAEQEAMLQSIYDQSLALQRWVVAGEEPAKP